MGALTADDKKWWPVTSCNHGLQSRLAFLTPHRLHARHTIPSPYPIPRSVQVVRPSTRSEKERAKEEAEIRKRRREAKHIKATSKDGEL